MLSAVAADSQVNFSNSVVAQESGEGECENTGRARTRFSPAEEFLLDLRNLTHSWHADEPGLTTSSVYTDTPSRSWTSRLLFTTCLSRYGGHRSLLLARPELRNSLTPLRCRTRPTTTRTELCSLTCPHSSGQLAMTGQLPKHASPCRIGPFVPSQSAVDGPAARAEANQFKTGYAVYARPR